MSRVEGEQTRWVPTQKWAPHHPGVHTHLNHADFAAHNDTKYKEYHKSLAKQSHQRIHSFNHDTTPEHSDDDHPEPAVRAAARAASKSRDMAVYMNKVQQKQIEMRKNQQRQEQ